MEMRRSENRITRDHLETEIAFLRSKYIWVLTAPILLGVAGFIARAMTPQAVVAQPAHLTNYHELAVGREGLAPGTDVTRSLPVEEHFYLLFPLGKRPLA